MLPETSYVTVAGFQIDELGAALLFFELYTNLADIDKSVFFSQCVKGLRYSILIPIGYWTNQKKYYNFPDTTRKMENKLIFIEYVPVIILTADFDLFLVRLIFKFIEFDV